MQQNIWCPGTYGHSQLKTGHPVRSAIHKQLNGRLVLRWVTTCCCMFCSCNSFLLANDKMLYVGLWLDRGVCIADGQRFCDLSLHHACIDLVPHRTPMLRTMASEVDQPGQDFWPYCSHRM
ncbi:hypothetical protein M437DRAFT_36967 [Aureobasidium melanogenum CBS 110374]|uniref:Uncharacterized protein n=1 Tax=Aureobasidium melanogenum (strain CBS 110374) TaxID=1043003 RepID=A0A074WZ68_AURM1|nr:hypothetical protein M437DRAFT_36967 [Aureobasidium melanogenum CBS 110374]